MAKVNLYDLQANSVGTVELNDAVFACEVNKQAIFDAILRQQSSLRQGTHDTKTRSEVSGGGKKPFRQKGTGHARQGSIRSTQYRGGGIVFGPTPRSHSFKLNRKVRRLALRSGLTLKATNENLVVVENLSIEAKTKEFVKVLNAFNFERKVMFVVEVNEDFENALLASSNLQNVTFTTVEGVNIYDLTNASKLVLTKQAAEKLGEVLSDE